eukprot:scaffold779_cov355-Prasinococcus_capsulatus_cf.AAC.1
MRRVTRGLHSCWAATSHGTGTRHTRRELAKGPSEQVLAPVELAVRGPWRPTVTAGASERAL